MFDEQMWRDGQLRADVHLLKKADFPSSYTRFISVFNTKIGFKEDCK